MAVKWPQVFLRELCDTRRGITYGIVQPGSPQIDGVPIIRADDVDDGRISTSNLMRVAPTVEASYLRSRIRGSEVLLTLVGAYFGKSAVTREEHIGFNTARAVGVIPVLQEPDFISYALRSPFCRSFMNERATTTAQPTLNLSDVAVIPIPWPPQHARETITGVLRSLDNKIDLNHRNNDTLEAMVRAIFKDWFIDFGPTRAKIEGRAPYLAPDIWALFPDRLDEGGKPEGWELRPVSDFAEMKGGKQLEKEFIVEHGPIPVFGGAGIMGYTTNHNADGFVISVGRVGAYCGQFFSFRGKAWINNNASLIRPKDDVSGEWLLLALRHANIDVIKKGAAQPFVSNRDIANIALIWPGHKVLSAFSGILIPSMLKMEQNNVEAQSLAATRDLLLPRLMSGEIHAKDAGEVVETAL
jgi:type I restriction enzyme, S subunit